MPRITTDVSLHPRDDVLTTRYRRADGVKRNVDVIRKKCQLIVKTCEIPECEQPKDDHQDAKPRNTEQKGNARQKGNRDANNKQTPVPLGYHHRCGGQMQQKVSDKKFSTHAASVLFGTVRFECAAD